MACELQPVARQAASVTAKARFKSAIWSVLGAEMKLAPEAREVSIAYRVPEPVMNQMVAGALYDAVHNMLAPRLTRRFRLVRKGGRQQTLEPCDDAPNLARDGRPPSHATQTTNAQETGPQGETLGVVSLEAGAS